MSASSPMRSLKAERVREVGMATGILNLTVLDESPFTRYLHSRKPYDEAMFKPISSKQKFVVECKGCERNVPAGVDEFPFASIIVTCVLCGEQRRYRPSEVCLGRVDPDIQNKRR
jgi:hypothetical protein